MLETWSYFAAQGVNGVLILFCTWKVLEQEKRQRRIESNLNYLMGRLGFRPVE